MKKIFLTIFLVLLFSFSIFSCGFVFVQGAGIVPECDQGYCTEIGKISELINNVNNFIVKQLVTALGILFFVIGGIVLLVSGGKPELKTLGKNIIVATVIGMALAWGAWAIIKFILTTLAKPEYIPQGMQ